MMKNEPIIAYNHLQEEQDESSQTMSVSEAGSKKSWRLLFSPVAIVIEIAAVIAMAAFMLEEIFR